MAALCVTVTGRRRASLSQSAAKKKGHVYVMCATLRVVRKLVASKNQQGKGQQVQVRSCQDHVHVQYEAPSIVRAGGAVRQRLHAFAGFSHWLSPVFELYQYVPPLRVRGGGGGAGGGVSVCVRCADAARIPLPRARSAEGRGGRRPRRSKTHLPSVIAISRHSAPPGGAGGGGPPAGRP